MAVAALTGANVMIRSSGWALCCRAPGESKLVSGSGDLLISRVPRVKLKLCDYQEQCFRFQLTVCPSCVGSCSQSSPLSAHNIQGAEEQKCILLYENM